MTLRRRIKTVQSALLTTAVLSLMLLARRSATSWRGWRRRRCVGTCTRRFSRSIGARRSNPRCCRFVPSRWMARTSLRSPSASTATASAKTRLARARTPTGSTGS